MSYFLKKSNLKKGVYLQIYESYYDPQRKGGAHRSYKALGYVNNLIASGIADPIAYYNEVVARMNRERKEEKQKEKVRQISEQSPERCLGYFPLKCINEELGVKGYLDIMQTVTDFKFNVFSVLSALIYARTVSPCSKSKTFEDVLPKLFDSYSFSLSQLYSALEYLGSEYEKVIEIYNHQIALFYPSDTSHTYFDCTNFYFEIDKEDDFRRKGPSKENRRDPIVGLGLLLDANQIPIGMKLYPGNESEKPVLRDIIDGLKRRNNISGRTIRVADKGLNCTENIVHALKSGDGYIFSKSVKNLPETEKVWVLLSDGYQDVKDENGGIRYRIKECIDDFEYTFPDDSGRNVKVGLPEKRIVTYNPELAKKQIYEINREVEKARSLCVSRAKKSEFGDCSKYVTFLPADEKGVETNGKIKCCLNKEAVENAKRLAGYNLIITSELKMTARQIYEAYHNLWRIEESFKIMKSQLDARPVYLQKEETITGHFLVCYLCMLLTRLFQFKVLENKYSSEDIFNLFKDYRVVQVSERKHINLTKKNDFIVYLSQKTNLPLLSYFLSSGELERLMSFKFLKIARPGTAVHPS